jgi:hypothetical protein
MPLALRLTTLALLSLCVAGTAPAQDTSSPEGFWYLSSGGQRLEMQLNHVGGNWNGWIRVEGAPGAADPIELLEWYPETRRLTFRSSLPGGLYRWYRVHVVEGVLKGRITAPVALPSQPAIAAFTGHITGWNATYLDAGLGPRAFDLVLDGQYRARLRIDVSPAGSGLFIGTLKLYASVDQGALGEALQYDLQVTHWDGTLLQFHRGHTSDWQAFSGTVDGRRISGHYFQAGDPVLHPWQGTRAEVLGRGVAPPSPVSQVESWQSRLRSQLALLTMARNPAPLGMSVTALQSKLPPFPSIAMTPRRDDNPMAWPRAYRLEELALQFELPNPYGADPLVRDAHAWLARPVTSANPTRAAVVVLNGHGGSAYSMMNPDDPGYWYGEAFARQGYVVLALDVSHRTHGDDPAHGNVAHPPIAAPGLGTDWEEDGERAWTAMRAIDYLLTLPEVDPSKIVVAGLSMGGEVASIVGAMDERVAATIVAGYSPDLAVIRHRDNHPCWEWNHSTITEYLEISDYLALVAPRLLVVQTGAIDPVFSGFQPPFASDKQVVRRGLPAHSALDGTLLHHLHDSGHAFRVGDIAVDGAPAPGIRTATIFEPTFPLDLDWQVDAQTTALGMNLFELLGWSDDSLEFIFSDGFEPATP